MQVCPVIYNIANAYLLYREFLIQAERKGYERLVNYIATHKAKVVGILDKFRTENISS